VLGLQKATACCLHLHLDQERHFQQVVEESLAVIIVERLACCQEEWRLIVIAGSTIVAHRTVTVAWLISSGLPFPCLLASQGSYPSATASSSGSKCPW